MADSVPQPFRGFRPEALQFLVDLSLNNERAWFQPRKGDYERLLKEPLEALCGALAERFADRGIPMVADAKRSATGNCRAVSCWLHTLLPELTTP